MASLNLQDKRVKINNNRLAWLVHCCTWHCAFTSDLAIVVHEVGMSQNKLFRYNSSHKDLPSLISYINRCS